MCKTLAALILLINMQRFVLLLVILAAATCSAKKEKDVTSLQIGVKFRPKECDKRTKVGDTLKVMSHPPAYAKFGMILCVSPTDPLHWQAH